MLWSWAGPQPGLETSALIGQAGRSAGKVALLPFHSRLDTSATAPATGQDQDHPTTLRQLHRMTLRPSSPVTANKTRHEWTECSSLSTGFSEFQ